MAAGPLRHRVTIQRVTETDDGAGGKSRAWNDLITVWASVLPTGGAERLIAGSLRTKQGWRIMIRKRGDMTITNKDRLKLDNGEIVNIASIEDPDGYREMLVALGETGSAN